MLAELTGLPGTLVERGNFQVLRSCSHGAVRSSFSSSIYQPRSRLIIQAQQASEESARNASFQMFRNQGPEYYGDIDEMDEKLADEEDALAREGEGRYRYRLQEIY